MHNSAHLFNPTTSHWPMYPVSSAPTPSFTLTNTLPASYQQIRGPRSPFYTNSARSLYPGPDSALPANNYASPWQITPSPYAYPLFTASGPNVVPSGSSAFLAPQTGSGFSGTYPARLANFSTPGLETILIAILILAALDLIVIRPHKYSVISER